MITLHVLTVSHYSKLIFTMIQVYQLQCLTLRSPSAKKLTFGGARHKNIYHTNSPVKQCYNINFTRILYNIIFLTCLLQHPK